MSLRRLFAYSLLSTAVFLPLTNACGNAGQRPGGPNQTSAGTSTTGDTTGLSATSSDSGSETAGDSSAVGSTGDSSASTTTTAESSGATTEGGDGDMGFVPQPPKGTEGYNCAPAEGTLPELKLTELAGGLDEPVQVTHAPNDPRLFIVLRDGRVLVFANGSVAEQPFLNISEQVVSNDEEGDHGDRALNALTFHPDFATNGIFYAYYNTIARDAYQTGDALLSEFTVGSDPNIADAATERVILHVPRNDHIDHHGGGLAFGGDGMLYLALGDGNSWVNGAQQPDPDQNGQNPATLLGSLLRIHPTPGGGYTSPSGNLAGAAPEVWDYGLRNPFRMSFDGCTGSLYIGDVGFEAHEEINIELPGRGGNNFGWPIMEGPDCLVSGCDMSGLTAPTYSYPWGPATTVIGGAVYRGSNIPALRGKYLYADFLRNQVHYFAFDEVTQAVTGVTDISNDLDNPQAVTSIGNGADGEIYFTTYGSFYSENSGALFRLEVE